MRILHAIHSVNSTSGGPIEGVIHLSQAAVSEGHTVEIVCLDDPNSAFLENIKVPVHAMGPGKGTYGYTDELLPWLNRNSGKFDVVVVNGIWQYQSFAVWRALRKNHTPYVVFCHGMLDPWFKKRYPLKHLKKWLYWPWAEYRVLRDAAAVLFTCTEERELARQSFWLYQATEVVIQYGTAKPPEEHREQTAEFLKMHPKLCGKRLAAFVGRIHPKKACDIVIHAFARQLAKDPNWELVIAGPDSVGWREELEGLARTLGVSGQITWTGEIRGRLKWGLLRHAEVFVLPSHQENFGIAVAEALACGTPVLISNKINIWRDIESDAAGLVGADTIDGFSKTLERWLLLSDEEKASMRRCARACFDERFEIGRSSKNTLDTMAHVVAQKRAATRPGAMDMQVTRNRTRDTHTWARK